MRADVRLRRRSPRRSARRQSRTVSSGPARVCLPPPRRAGGIILPPEFFLSRTPTSPSESVKIRLSGLSGQRLFCAGCVKSDSARRHRSAPSSLQLAINIKRRSIFFFLRAFQEKLSRQLGPIRDQEGCTTGNNLLLQFKIGECFSPNFLFWHDYRL